MDIQQQYAMIEELTRQREGSTLCAIMGKIINQLTGSSNIKLHFVNNEPNDLSAANEETTDVASSFISTKLTESEQSIIKTVDHNLFNPVHPFIPHGNITLMPLYADDSIVGVFMIDKHVPQQHELILRVILNIFINQFTLINYCMKDALTGLFNRQAFDKIMKRLVSGQEMPGRRQDDKPGEWFFALADIDHFKHINDQFGHIYGDEVLLLFSRIMSQSVREDDLLFRYGGEEFAIALRNVNEETSNSVLERIRQNVAEHAFPQVGNVTISIGYTCLKTNRLISDITDAADKALYFAKEHGRNQTHHYERLIETGMLQTASYDSQDVELF